MQRSVARGLRAESGVCHFRCRETNLRMFVYFAEGAALVKSSSMFISAGEETGLAMGGARLNCDALERAA